MVVSGPRRLRLIAAGEKRVLCLHLLPLFG